MESDQTKDAEPSTGAETPQTTSYACAWCNGDHLPIYCPVRHPQQSIEDLPSDYRIRAEERERCAVVAQQFTLAPHPRIHPDVSWEQMSDSARSVAHTTAQQIATAIRSGQ